MTDETNKGFSVLDKLSDIAATDDGKLIIASIIAGALWHRHKQRKAQAKADSRRIAVMRQNNARLLKQADALDKFADEMDRVSKEG